MTASLHDTVTQTLGRIAQSEGRILAWTRLLAPAEQGEFELRGPLAGVAVGVKDIIDTHDFATERGSEVFRDRRPDLDAAIVSQLRRLGAVIVGKTVTTEFGMREPGPTTNPHDSRRTPGGSSSGSAAAVAAGHVSLAVGTQTGGSIIRPAGYCGVWAIKPTFGLIDRFGVQLHSSSIDTVGLFAESGEILARATGIVLGGDDRSGPEDQPRRFRFLRSRRDRHLDPADREALEAWLEVQRAAGNVEHDAAVPPFDEDALDDAHRVITRFEAARLLWGLYVDHHDEISEHVHEMVESGKRITLAEYTNAQNSVEDIRAQTDAWLTDGPVLAPTARSVAPIGLSSTGSSEYCRAWTLLGNPCVSVPGLRGSAGMPFGIQAIGPRHWDRGTISAARRLARLSFGDPETLDRG